MEPVRRWWLLPLALGLLVVAACSRVVPGTPSASGGSAAGGAPASAARVRGPTVQADVLADECLLDAAQLRALLGRPVRAEQSVVRRDDGTRSTSCYAIAVDEPRAALAAINVYRVRSGTPADVVRAAGGRALAGTGQAATLLETSAGPTLQVAGPEFLVTLVVQGRSPPDDAWRAAARAALTRLPA